MVTDEELTNISFEIDDFLLKLVKEYDIETLNLSSIIIARMIRMNESANCEDHFYQLLSRVPEWRTKLNDRTLQ